MLTRRPRVLCGIALSSGAILGDDIAMSTPGQPPSSAPPPVPGPSPQLSSIQHIVQLMLENRSFDHMLGFLYAGTRPGPAASRSRD
jgi:phospholipase C